MDNQNGQRKRKKTARGRHGGGSALIGIGRCKARDPRVVRGRPSSRRPFVRTTTADSRQQTADSRRWRRCAPVTRAPARLDFASQPNDRDSSFGADETIRRGGVISACAPLRRCAAAPLRRCAAAPLSPLARLARLSLGLASRLSSLVAPRTTSPSRTIPFVGGWRATPPSTHQTVRAYVTPGVSSFVLFRST